MDEQPVAPDNPDLPETMEDEPALMMAIDLPIAGSSFSPGDHLISRGWVLSSSSVAEISVSADQKHLGYASYGFYRPDLEEAFPRYPNADHSGFSFSAALDLAPAEVVNLVFAVRTVDGRHSSATIPIQIAHSSSAAEQPERLAVRRLPLQLRIDRSVIGPGGEVQVVGWAVARTPIEYVKIYAGDTLLGTAELGHARPDIGAEWSDYPNAANPGFSFIQAAPPPAVDLKVLRIEAAAQDGSRREAIVPATSGIIQVSEAGADIAFHCDHISLTSAGRLVISGWSASPHGIDEVIVIFDGRDEVGKAELGLARPDVAQAHPTLARADHSGLAFVHQLDVPVTGEHMVTMNIRSGHGALRVISLPVLAEIDRPDINTQLRLEIDSPMLENGVAVAPVRGSLRVEGWVLARAGVARITAYIDDVESGDAYYGLRREDVAAAYPDWNDALLSGFGISMPGKQLTPGTHSVRIELRDRAGGARSTTFSVAVEFPAERRWPDALRSRIPASERQLDWRVLSSLGWEPRFGVYMKVDATEIVSARATLASLRDQEYGNWHLIALVPSAEVLNDIEHRLLSGFERLMQPVKLRVRRDDLGTVAQGDNSTSDHAAFCCVLSPGDRLGQDALLEVALATGLDSDADFIYSDEIRLDTVTGKVVPYFKPDWSPDLLLSRNYIGRFWAARADLLKRTSIDLEGGFSDYSTVLRLTRSARKIAHIQKPLCERGYCVLEDFQSERTALEHAVREMGIEASILPGCAPGIYRLKRALKKPGLVSIIIPTCGARHLIKTCISSLRKITANQNFEIVCIENIPESQSRTRQWVESNAEKTIRIDESFNWSRFNNLAARATSPKAAYYLFLNDDTEVFEAEWLDALLEHGQREEVGVTGALLLYPDRSVQHAALHLVGPGLGRHASRFSREDDPGSFGRTLTQRNVVAVTGACMLVRRSFFEALGGFDAAHTVINNDLDFCLRSLDRGARVLYTPYARLVHHEMASRSSMNDLYDISRLETTWRKTFAEGDPFYNPLLSRVEDNFSTELEPVETIFGGHPLMHRDEVRAILAIKLDHIGDFVTAFPSFRRIKEKFPRARLCVLASSVSAKLASLEPSIDEVIEFNFFHENSSQGQVEVSESRLAALRQRLAAECFDIAIDLRKHPETRELLRQADAKLTAGFDSESRFPWLDIVLEWEKDGPLFVKRQHVADDLLNLVDAVAVACDSDRRTIGDAVTQRWQFNYALQIHIEGLFDKPVVCVHPAAGNPLRTWPSKHFAELIELIVDEFDVNIAIIGAPGDSEIVGTILSHLNLQNTVFPLLGGIPLEHLPQFLSCCALFIGNNSGPQHVAAGVGVPTIGIHSGVVDAHEWAPIGPLAVAIRRDMTCSPCYFALAEQCSRGVACLSELRPGDVMPTCRKLLTIRAWNHRRHAS